MIYVLGRKRVTPQEMVEYSEQKEMAKEVEIMQNDAYIEDEKCRNMVDNSEEFYRKHFACVAGMIQITFIVDKLSTF